MAPALPQPRSRMGVARGEIELSGSEVV